MKNILNPLVCFIIGHGNKFIYKVQKEDGKIYEITTCHRCWKETERLVK